MTYTPIELNMIGNNIAYVLVNIEELNRGIKCVINIVFRDLTTQTVPEVAVFRYVSYKRKLG